MCSEASFPCKLIIAKTAEILHSHSSKPRQLSVQLDIADHDFFEEGDIFLLRSGVGYCADGGQGQLHETAKSVSVAWV